MDDIIYYIFYDLQGILIIVSFYFSLKDITNKNAPVYMKGFYLYPLVSVIVGIPHFLAAHFSIGISIAIVMNNFSLIFHFTFLSLFIMKVITKKREKKILKLMYFFFLCCIIYFTLKEPWNQGGPAFSISSLGLTIFCVFYYFQLFRNLPILILRKEPSFWVITGVFFAMCLQTPIQAVFLYLTHRVSYSAYLILIDITIFSFIIMYLSFIKAFICTVPEKRR